MDIEMKNMDGLTATRSLLQSFPKARVIILSKQGDQYMYEAARQAGACAYVPKENVLVVLHSILSKSPVANLMFAVWIKTDRK